MQREFVTYNIECPMRPEPSVRSKKVLIRCFVPKGFDIGNLTRADVKRIAHWMNHDPRRKLDNPSAFEASPLAAILHRARVI